MARVILLAGGNLGDVRQTLRSAQQLIRLIRGEPAQDVQIDANLSIESSTQYIL